MFVFVCLTSLSMKICKSIQYGQVFIVYIYHILSTHLLVDGHLGCFHVLAIVYSAAVNIVGRVYFPNQSFLWVCAQEWDCWIIWQLCFQFFWESLYCSPQLLHQFAFSPTMQEGSIFSTAAPDLFFVMTSVRQYLIVLIHIFLTISDVEYLFMCLLAICLFRSSTHSLIFFKKKKFLFLAALSLSCSDWVSLQLWHADSVALLLVGSWFPSQGSNPHPLIRKSDS